ncbi:MAG: DUF421 domain-containing protein [Candidatus Dormibacteria bacterium]|jgi:uncharacterized membrane protein YcaP (DUF421 family)
MDLTHLAIPPWDLILRSVAIYVVLMMALRIFGKRELGQMTIFDLVLVLLVANAVQPAMTGPDSSLLGGFIIISTLFVLNWIVNWGRIHSPRVRRLLESPARVLASDGAWIPGALAKEGVDQDEADMALREHGVSGVGDAELVEMESDGTISVVPKQESGRVRPRRRMRVLRRP